MKGLLTMLTIARLLCFSLLVLLSACGERSTDHGHAPSPAAAAKNPVQAEMRLLNEAMEAAVRGIGAGDVREVEHALHRVHAAKETTEAALKDGSYHPPKNSDKLARFAELDEAFHRELERLVEASRSNDVTKTTEALSSALRACQPCHSEFK